MTIYWPDNLPLGIRYGATTEFGKGTKITTDMDYGNKKRRRRFARVPAYQQITFKLNDSQIDQFQAFYQGVLQNGVISFNAKVINGSLIEEKRCTIDDDTLTITHADYNYHEVSFMLEIYDLLGLDDGAAYLIGLYGEEFVLSFYDYLQYVVNVQTPNIVDGP